MLRELISTAPTTQKHVVDWLQIVRIEGNGRLKGSKKRSTAHYRQIIRISRKI